MEASEKIRIVIAEDEQPIREGLKKKIEELDSNFSVVALAADGTQALEMVDTYSPKIVITDIKMPGLDGIELIRKLKLSHPAVYVVVLSGYSDFAYTQKAIRFGVFNYLLKPIEDETLLETLTELKRVIRSEQHQRTRNVIYSSNYCPQRPSPVRYLPMIICLGNLCFDNTDPLLLSHYQHISSQIPWHDILGELLPDAIDWYLADEDDPNQKLICYSLNSETNQKSAETALNLRYRLQAILSGTSVTVCTCESSVIEEDVWLCAERLRSILRQRVIPGRGAVFLMERDEMLPENELLGIVKMRVNDHLRCKIEQRQFQDVLSELQMLFQFMQDNSLPQNDWMHILNYILRMMEFTGLPVSLSAQADVMRRLSLCLENRVAGDVSISIIQCLPGQEKQLPDDPDALAHQIAEYLDRNFIALENLEEITSIFPYNYAYLARLFKRSIGISMGQYVLNKRMDLAKQLICNNENLTIAEIGEMSGYHDSRYFARTFKTYFGMSPKEYRASKICLG